MDKIHTCCFSGHRPEKLNISEIEVKNRLQTAVKEAIQDGFQFFITGMARGVDIWAAEIVLNEKSLNSNIELICAVPFENFENSRSQSEKKRYCDIINASTNTIYICKHYFKGAFQFRNHYMVDNSSRVICAYNGENGGTKNTLVYAKRSGVEIVNVLECNLS